MGIIDSIVGLGGSLLWIISLGVAATGYWWFYRYRTAVATVAGFGAGLVGGMTVGVGVPVIVGGIGGALLGLFGARAHPRGGTIVVGAATGIAFGPLVAVMSTGAMTAAVSLGGGVVLGIALAGFGWRFPRTVIVAGTAGLASVTNFAITLGLAQSVTEVLSGSLFGASVFAGEANAFVYLGAFISLVLGPMAQSVLIECSETVPPLLPAWIRRLFEFDERYGETPDTASPSCPECGAIGDPGHGACHACGAAADAEEYGVPDGAVAVDIPCSHCVERPIEETATARKATGFLLAYRIRTEQYVGCHTCVRRKMWASAGKTAITGWFSITCILLNPVFILWNLGRGLVNRGPTLPLAGVLDDSGVEFEYIYDTSAFDPGAFHQDEVVDPDDFTVPAAE